MRDGIVPVMDVNGNNNGIGFGDNGAWWIILFLIFGYGRGFGGFGGYGSGADANYVLTSDFSQLSRQISDSTAMTERKLDSITNGICTLGYDNLVQTNTINSNINTIGMNLQDCCCQTQRAIDGVNYNLATNTCAITTNATNNTRDIIDAVNANYRSLHEELVQNRIEDKNAQIQAQQNEINALRLRASQEAQNNYLVEQLGTKCPVPAYLTCNPNAPLNYSINYGNCGCGCN